MGTRIALVFACLIFAKDTYTIGLSEDGRLNFPELAKKYGHDVEEYDVITEDGYILRLFRIPGGSGSGPPVLLMHGVFESADTWIIRGNASLAIALADLGRDVWAGNCRGNRYSRRHIYLDPNANDGFWDFTFHEFGYYDLSATIDTVLHLTQSVRLTAIGFSQGNTIFYVLGSTRPEYNDKINVIMALAPICFLQNVPPPLSTIIEAAPTLDRIAHYLNVQELFRDNSALTDALRTVCSVPFIGYSTCVLGAMFPLAGYDAEELEESSLRTLIGHFPSGTSVKNLIHFAQVSRRRMFARYDHGAELNLARYNACSPPEYDLSAVTMQVALFVGANDRLATVEDVAILAQKLPNIQRYQLVPRRKMNHIDFVFGRHMGDYLFPYIFDALRTTE